MARNRNRKGWGGGTIVSDTLVDSFENVTYDPNPAPENREDLGRYVVDEFFKIRDALYDIINRGDTVTDFMLSVAKGDVAGHSTVNKFGRNPAIANSATETIWDGSTSYTFPTVAAGATIVSIWQNVDVVANRGTVLEVQGLDVNWGIVTQDATLNASDSSTEVTLTTALRRVFRVKAKTNITSNVNVGTSGKATALATCLATENQTQMAIWTCPTGYTAYITKYYASVNETSNKSIDGVAKLYVIDNENGYPQQIKHTLGMDQDATSLIEHEFKPYFKVTEKSDVYINFFNAVASVADVSAGFDIILVEDGY